VRKSKEERLGAGSSTSTCRSETMLPRSRVDHVAVRSPRHQTILHFAGRGQLMGQPYADCQQGDGDRQPRQRPTPTSAWFTIIHPCQPLPPTSLANVSRNPMVRLNTRRDGVESGSRVK
jgi:hypothetical protein